ncbi:MAG: U32 family peptidase, partial [Sphaerochaetaceae bacterium]
RSANRGACAQICRNYFTIMQDSNVADALSPIPQGTGTGWFFSMSDLKAGQVARQLEALGIESLKVEGRMKSPVYTGLAARYYHAILEGEDPAEEALSIAFSRRQTSGWLASYGREKQDFTIRKAPTLGSTSYPGHRGIKAAKITLLKRDTAIVTLLTNVSLRDGLMYFIRDQRKPVETVKFGIRSLIDQWGKTLTEAYRGESVAIELPDSSPLPHAGEYLYLISRHDQNPAYNNEALPLSKHCVDMTFTLSEGSLAIQSKYGKATYAVPTNRAEKTQDTEANIAAIFSQSDTSYLALDSPKIVNNTNHPLNQLFIPLSMLKSIRRDWYALLDRALAQQLTENLPRESVTEKLIMQRLPPRSLLQTEQKLPYLDLKSLLNEQQPLKSVLFSYEGMYYLPLSPVMFDEDAFFANLNQVITRLKEENLLDNVRFGLNNLGQVPYFRETHLPCFFDIYFYLANSEAAKLALTFNLRLVGGYLWMEQEQTDLECWPFVPTVTEAAFKPPLFISRSCFRHDSLLLGCKGCPHRGSWYVQGDNQRYRVLVEDCITTVVQA